MRASVYCKAGEGGGDHVMKGLVASGRNVGFSLSAVEIY